MIAQSIAEVGVGALAGGGLQFASEGFKLFQGLIAGYRDMALQQNEQAVKLSEARTKAMDAASKRVPVKTTSFVVITVIVCAFILPSVLPYLKNMDTSIVQEKEPWLNIFGLLKLGGGYAVTTVSGVVHGPEFWPMVRAVGGFVLGAKAVSTGVRF